MLIIHMHRLPKTELAKTESLKSLAERKASSKLGLRTRRPGKKWVSGLRPEIGKNSSRDWSRNWPHRENREKIAQNLEYHIFSHFFPIFQAGPISGPISGAFFFLFRAGGPKPIFYQVGGFSKLGHRLPAPKYWALLNGWCATFVWQERAHTHVTRMTHMACLKPLSSLRQNQRSLRHLCVICLPQQVYRRFEWRFC